MINGIDIIHVLEEQKMIDYRWSSNMAISIIFQAKSLLTENAPHSQLINYIIYGTALN
jgi:hypothetical protein